MNVIMANPRGFCAGVDRAIEIVRQSLTIFGAPIYVRHEVVHNRFVVDQLRAAGAVFVDELSEVPDEATVIFSAHGVSKAVRNEGKERGLKVFDATCPLVTKVHMEVIRYGLAGLDVVLIGHAGHPEVEGTLGQWDDSNAGKIHLVEKSEEVDSLMIDNETQLAYVSQTTLSVDETRDIVAALVKKYPDIEGPKKDDICYATQNRQDAVVKLAKYCDCILVVGSPNSSNSNRLRELAEKKACPSWLIDGPEDIQPAWLDGKTVIGITAGASAPENLVQAVVERLRELGADKVENIDGRDESIVFSLPKELRVKVILNP
ncbi:MAG: 4-hydroxy-3-methylbut-2-enyl diphosphate reductase [bacterium]